MLSLRASRPCCCVAHMLHSILCRVQQLIPPDGIRDVRQHHHLAARPLAQQLPPHSISHACTAHHHQCSATTPCKTPATATSSTSIPRRPIHNQPLLLPPLLSTSPLPVLAPLLLLLRSLYPGGCHACRPAQRCQSSNGFHLCLVRWVRCHRHEGVACKEPARLWQACSCL